MLRMLILRYDSSTDLDAIAQDAGYLKSMPKRLWAESAYSL
ncbi:MAG: hypothetical protein U7127_03245 [Phormidium sp.]|uniref:Uncharacterized protein n=1 Tax=Floridaenema flaviceps BLCC-F50 TaxID=3153642 RepID=A0ABV4XYY1_9CYAN